MSALVTPTTVTEPGLYDLPADVYHRDPVPAELGGSLSFSGAKLLLAPSCPAKFAYYRENGRPGKRAYDFGHAAHKEVLGIGPEIVVVEADEWRTKAAKDERAAAYAAGKVPLLRDEWATVRAMAQSLREHPWASKLLTDGRPEQAAFWQDAASGGVWRRCMYDWLRNPGKDRMLVTDYKTTAEGGAHPTVFGQSAAKFGYHQQASYYLDGIEALSLADDAVFLFVVQEKVPPYLVSVAELDTNALRIGRERNHRALEIYAECQSSGVWPAYANDVALVSLPRWAETQHDQEMYS